MELAKPFLAVGLSVIDGEDGGGFGSLTKQIIC
jgi:hypothetical protein